MSPTTWTRRKFLGALAGAGAALPLSNLLGCSVDDTLPPGTILSAADTAFGEHRLTALNLQHGVEFSVPVTLRGHASALHPSASHVALVARRPGTELHIIDWRDGSTVAQLTSTAQRHFLGHAVYSRDGGLLYATENVVDDAALPDLTPRHAVIGIYDAGANYARIGEHPAHGVGSHELCLLGDGATLGVANGGIYTHPSQPREKLNIDTMAPSLAFVDAQTGALESLHQLPDQKLSVRHLAEARNGAVFVGMQYEGDAASRVPLVAVRRPGEPLTYLEATDDAWAGLDQYVGSIAVHPDANMVAATSPRGDRIAFWHTETGRYAGAIEAADVSGVAAVAGDFIASAGTGTICAIDAYDLRVRRTLDHPDIRWDNHLAIAPG